MPTLTLICGLPGAGKTTLARQLAAERAAVRLCPDEWIARVLLDPAHLDALRGPVEELQWELAQELLGKGIDVILEFGFWSHEERRRFQEQAEELGAQVEIHVLTVSQEELWTRLEERNRALPAGTFPVTREQLAEWWSWFEPWLRGAEHVAESIRRAAEANFAGHKSGGFPRGKSVRAVFAVPLPSGAREIKSDTPVTKLQHHLHSGLVRRGRLKAATSEEDELVQHQQHFCA